LSKSTERSMSCYLNDRGCTQRIMAPRSILAIIALLCTLGARSQRAKSKDEKYKVLKEEWCGPHNCYDLLEVAPECEFRDIKSKYNNLSLALHPDKNPNQSDADRERYVRINKAYEILSSRRRDYDEFLRIKVSMDSPVENPIVVLVMLYFGISFVVLFYQRDTQKKVKEAILKHNDVVRYYWDQKSIDLTGKRKDKKSPRSKSRKKKKKKQPQNVEEVIAGIDVEEINEVLAALNMHVPEWKGIEPSYKSACWDVATSVTWGLTELLFRARWALKYNVLGQNYSEEDREHLCMKHHRMSEVEWERLSDKQRKSMMSKSGIWNRRAKKRD